MNDIKPYGHASKKEEVRIMFDDISSRYDFLNRFLSFSIDRYWRKKLVQHLSLKPGARILDVATGTADLALACMKLAPSEIIGIDISPLMLEVGKKKLRDKNNTIIRLLECDIMDFKDNTGFDAITMAFGIRNFEYPEEAMKKMFELLKPGGQLAILEFASHEKGLWNTFFRFYFHSILPRLGNWISGNSRAYSYLPESVKAFPSGPAFVSMMEKAQFHSVQSISLTGGICYLYVGGK